MLASWTGHELQCRRLFAMLLQVEGLPEALQSPWPRLVMVPEDRQAVPRFHKLSHLLGHLETAPRYPAGVLQAIEGFVVAGQRWLKVAGGTKAEVITSSMAQHAPHEGRAAVELGCFVGYTATRLASCCEAELPPPAVVSCEFEVIHVCVSRYALACARIGSAEVWAGHLPWISPRIAEQLGEAAVSFTFMDHKGTRFHEDRRHFDALGLYAPNSCVLCDNVVHPGAPEYLWAERLRPLHRCFALQEFAQTEALEDWQSFLQDPGGK